MHHQNDDIDVAFGADARFVEFRVGMLPLVREVALMALGLHHDGVGFITENGEHTGRYACDPSSMCRGEEIRQTDQSNLDTVIRLGTLEPQGIMQGCNLMAHNAAR